MNKKSKDMESTREFSTLPIVQADNRAKKSKAPLPSDKNIERAKSWVDFNKK